MTFIPVHRVTHKGRLIPWLRLDRLAVKSWLNPPTPENLIPHQSSPHLVQPSPTPSLLHEAVGNDKKWRRKTFRSKMYGGYLTTHCCTPVGAMMEMSVVWDIRKVYKPWNTTTVALGP